MSAPPTVSMISCCVGAVAHFCSSTFWIPVFGSTFSTRSLFDCTTACVVCVACWATFAGAGAGGCTTGGGAAGGVAGVTGGFGGPFGGGVCVVEIYP